MKKRLKRYITILIAVMMCTGMVLPTVQAAGIQADENLMLPEEDRDNASGKSTEEEVPSAGNETGQEQTAQDIESPIQELPDQTTTAPQPTTVRPMDDTLGALMSGQKTMQGVFAEEAVKRTIPEQRETNPAVVELDISKGSIVLADGTYQQEGTFLDPVTQTNETYIIKGTSGENNITVKPNSSPKITIDNLQVDLRGKTVNNSTDRFPVLDVESGGTVTLTLKGNSKFAATALSSAIRLQGRGSVAVQGEGNLELISGAGAYAVGDNDGQGGSFGVGTENAKVVAYSNKSDKAIHVQNMYTTVKILQGALEPAKVDNNNPTRVYVENRSQRDQKYKMTLPNGYASFATTTSLAGGEFVAYLPQAGEEVEDATLLVDNNGKYVYALSSIFTASLSQLSPQRVTYSVTFDANKGAFSSGLSQKRVTDIGYGELVAEPEKPTKANNETDAWYLDKEAITAKWELATDTVVRDMVLYMNWIPNTYGVTFIPGSGSLTQQFRKTYTKPNNYIPEDAVKSITNGDYTLDGWYTDTTPKKKWKFGPNGDRLTKEEMTLRAVWLPPCDVTFMINTDDKSAVNINPAKVTVPATTAVGDPGEGPNAQKPTRDKYIFSGWYTTPQCTTKWDFSEPVKNSMSLHAGWEAETTVVTFDPGEGGHVTNPEIPVAHNRPILEPPKGSVTKDPRPADKNGNMATNYVFDGWYTEDKPGNPGKKWDFSTPLATPDGKLTLYAKWHQETCWITLKANDKGAEPAEKVISTSYDSPLKGEELAKLFNKKGHTITSWSQNNKVWDFNTPVKEDITMLANWTPNKYKVSFHVTDAEPDVPKLASEEESQIVTYGGAVTKPKYPKEEWLGHTFNGWYTQENGAGSLWAFQGEPSSGLVEEEMDLYAYWTWDEYELTWDYQDGVTESVTEENTYHYGDKIEEPEEPNRTNYIFDGWYSDPTYAQGSEWIFGESEITGSMTLYAKWIGEPRDLTLNITYESVEEGGTGETVTQKPMEVRYGDKLVREDLENEKNPDTKKRLGYTLYGWYLDKEHTIEWDFDTQTIADDQQLYAYWTRNVYTVEFYTYDDDPNPMEAQKCYYGAKLTKPEKPTRQHYKSDDKWYTDGEATQAWEFGKDTVTDNMTLYANWIPNEYTLSFETNGGKPSLDPIKVIYGTYPDPKALDTKMEGYVINAWYKEPEFKNVFDPMKDLVDGDMTIYAQWKLEEYTVTFHYQDEKGSNKEEIIQDEILYNVGDYIKEPTVKKEHKNLSNWYQDKDLKSRWLFKRDKVKGNMDLYAFWSDTQYDIQFITYDGTVIPDEKLPWGELVTRPEKDPERTGYTFTGWYKDENATKAWDFDNDFVEGGTKIYSGWNAKEYTVTFDLKDGTGEVPSKQKLKFGTKIKKPQDPVKKGFTFAGWKAEVVTETEKKAASVFGVMEVQAAAEGTWNFEEDTVSGDMILAALWEADPANGPGQEGENLGGENPPKKDPAGDTDPTKKVTDAADAAAQAIQDAAAKVAKVLTGDKAPLTYALAGTFVGAMLLIWALIRKFK